MRALISKRAALALWLAMAGCDVEAEEAPDAEPEIAGLARGARGEEVARVNDALLAQGYFPDDEIAEAFPSWIAAVAEGPAANDVFDARTEEAVTIFQATHALPITGIVDVATRDLLTALRCGNPVMHGAANDVR